MYLLFDIGGTKMRLAVSPDLKTLGAAEIVPTPREWGAARAIFRDIALRLLGGKAPEAIAGGIAGVFNRERTTLTWSPHLSGWLNQSIAHALATDFACPIFLENDTALVGLGEALFGAGRGKRLVAYITVSTGVGGVRLINGQIDERLYGFEPGHQIIDYREPTKRLEDYISGAGVSARLGQAVTTVKDPAIWDELARILALGLHNTILHWSPELVVLGGSMITGTPAISFSAIERYLQELPAIFPDWPLLKKAELADQGGLWGALHYLRQKLSA